MIKDAWSNRIVGYSIKPTMHADIVVDAIEHAVARRGVVASCILHADLGSQFRSEKVHRAPCRHDMVGSMGRVASSVDNALIESLWSTMQRELLDRHDWESRTELASAMFERIEAFYNPRRRHSSLGDLNPAYYEALHNHVATAA